MNASITELTCSILKRFRVLEPGRVVVSVAHRRPTPPLMLVVEKPVLHLNHWTLGHVVDNKNFPNSTNTNTQNGEPKKSLFPPFELFCRRVDEKTRPRRGLKFKDGWQTYVLWRCWASCQRIHLSSPIVFSNTHKRTRRKFSSHTAAIVFVLFGTLEKNRLDSNNRQWGRKMWK
jgi:hypothetical protein